MGIRQKSFLRLMILLILLVSVFVVYVWYMEQSSVFVPYRTIEQTPQAVGLEYEEVFLRAADATQLHGWFVGRPHPRATVLLLHGNGGNISHRVQKMRIFHDLGLEVLVFDYRGYGRSKGAPSEKGLYADARAAYDHLVVERGAAPAKIILYGESLGSAVAVELATEKEVGGIILEGAFTCVADMARRVFPYLPTLFLRYRFNTLEKVRRVKVPLLVIHSRNDEVVPFSMGRRIFDAAHSDTKDILAVYGGHNESFYEYRREIAQKIEELLEEMDR